MSEYVNINPNSPVMPNFEASSGPTGYNWFEDPDFLQAIEQPLSSHDIDWMDFNRTSVWLGQLHPSASDDSPGESDSPVQMHESMGGGHKLPRQSRDDSKNSATQLAQEHALATKTAELECGECSKRFQHNEQLLDHLATSSHKPFACQCGALFARLDSLRRHVASKLKNTDRFLCRHCQKRGVEKKFHRKDHLRQHLNGYHNINTERYALFLTCQHTDCDGYREPSFHLLPHEEQVRERPFKTRAQYNKHMKMAHNETPFPCRVSGCNKVDSAGFMTHKALATHCKSNHPGVPVPESAGTVLCPFPDCNKAIYPENGRYHMYYTHNAPERPV